MINQTSKFKSFFSTTSFASAKRSTKKSSANATLAVETKAKKLGIVSSGIPFGQFRLSLRFLASSKTPTPLRLKPILESEPLCEHVYKINSTKQPSTNCMSKAKKPNLKTDIRFESVKKIELTNVLSRNFQMFESRSDREEFLKIREVNEIFSSENRSRQFGSTFAAKGGNNLKNSNLLNSNSEFNLNTEVFM